ncbi:MAG: short-chain dehydrogenase [Chloroflexi bacterium]|nr:short-chain dehydrogenase [Chloroflexota bacterium]|tara:strand:+ start:3281 stop:4114 length:834 start_codon:yes stop_codon:yes gene_type:complete
MTETEATEISTIPATTGTRLLDKRAIITGAGSRASGIGNGRAASILFALEGAKVLLVDSDLNAAEETKSIIVSLKPDANVITMQGNVTDEKSCKEIVTTISNQWGGVDILHNNVGIGMPRSSVVDADMDEWDKVQETNVRSMVLTSRYAIPEMEKSSGGSIINVSSIAALRPRGMTAYSTSKGAVIALTQAMAVDHADQGIRVNCIVPGPVYTPMVYSRGMEPSLRERRKNASLLGIEGNGWDIGATAVFLASDESRYITGVILPVDGGVHIKGPDR